MCSVIELHHCYLRYLSDVCVWMSRYQLYVQVCLPLVCHGDSGRLGGGEHDVYPHHHLFTERDWLRPGVT